MAELAEAQKELAQAQKQTEQTMAAGFSDLDRRFGVLGSRWGDGAEGAFRQGCWKPERRATSKEQSAKRLIPRSLRPALSPLPLISAFQRFHLAALLPP